MTQFNKMQLKTALKTALFSTFGERRIRAIIRSLRGTSRVFSEADLIYEYFSERPNPGVMVDVGAHFGESFRPYLQSQWEIYAFEPDSKNRANLLLRTNVNRIKLFPVAVSDHDADEVSFFASEESDGISSLSAFRPTHHEVEKVKIRTLSRILEEENVGQVNFLKIDTEGHDLFVLKGFPWDRIKPDIILCEFEDSKTQSLGYDYRALGDYLVGRGYTVFLSEWAPIIKYGTIHKWRSFKRFPCALEDSNAWGNMVAVCAGLSESPILRYVRRFQNQI